MKKYIIFVITSIILFLTACDSILSNEEYTIILNESVNGEYTVNKEKACKDDDIIVSTTPNKGYRFDYIQINNRIINDTKFDMPKNDVTLNVYFTPITYNINYMVDRNVFTTVPTRTYTIEDEINLNSSPIKDGYKFLGWYMDTEFSKKVTKIEKGSTEDITLYPKFELEEYKITYHIDAETINDNVTSYNINDDNIKLNDPIKENYIFMGWYNNESFKGDKITHINTSYSNYNLYPKFISNKRDSNGYRLIESQLDFEVIFIEQYDKYEKYKLMTDIDFSNINWTPKEFCGEFNGGNKTISNLTIDKKSTYEGYGFFSSINNATIKNLKLEYKINISPTDYINSITGIGGLVGSAVLGSTNTIQNIKINNSSINVNSTKGVSIGGIIGIASDKTNIKSCSVNNLNIDARSNYTSFIGGICGRYGNISECSVVLNDSSFIINNTGESQGSVALAGILGQGNNSTIKNSYFIQNENSKLMINQANANTTNCIAGINADSVLKTTIDSCYGIINEFVFKKRNVVENSTIYIFGLGCKADILNSFVCSTNDSFTYTTLNNDNSFTPYNDPYNTYYIGYISNNETISSYVQYTNILINNLKYPDSEIHDYNRITSDLKSTLYNIFKNVWDTHYWKFSDYSYPVLK